MNYNKDWLDQTTQTTNIDPLQAEQETKLNDIDMRTNLGTEAVKKASALNAAELKKQMLGSIADSKKAALNPASTIDTKAVTAEDFVLGQLGKMKPSEAYALYREAAEAQTPAPVEVMKPIQTREDVFNGLVDKAASGMSYETFAAEAGNELSPNESYNLYTKVQSAKANQTLDAARETLRLVTPRTPTKVTNDTVSSLAKGFITIAEGAYGLSNAGLANRLENFTGVGKALKMSKDWWNENLSDKTKYSKQQAALAVEQSIARELDKLEAKKVNGVNSIFDWLPAAGNLVKDGAMSLIDNPEALTDSILESAVAFLLPVGFATATRSNLLSAVPKEAREEFLKANGDAIDKKVKLASLIGIASLEAGSTSNELQQKILSMTPEELGQYDKYNKMISEGVDPTKAKQALAADASLIAYGLTAIGAAGISKLAGSDKVANMLSKPISRLGGDGVVKRTAGAGVSELLEETPQSALSVVATNVGNISAGKEGQDVITPDVFTSAGQGAVSGALSGAGTTAVLSTLTSSAEAATKAVDKVQAVKAENDLVNRTKAAVTTDSIDRTSLTAVREELAKNSPNNPEPQIAALRGLMEGVNQNKEGLLADSTKLNEVQEEIDAFNGSIYDALVNQVSQEAKINQVRKVLGLEANVPITQENVTAYEEMASKDSAIYDQEDDAILEAVDTLSEHPTYKKLLAIKSQTEAFFKTTADAILNKTEIDEQEGEALLRAFGSTPTSFNVQDYQKLMGTKAYQAAPAQVKAKLGAAYELVKFLSDEVNASVVEGGKNDLGSWVGVKNYLDRFNVGASNQNTAVMQQQQAMLQKWYLTKQLPKLQELEAYEASGKALSEKQKTFFENVRKEAAMMDKVLSYMEATLTGKKVRKPSVKAKVVKETVPAEESNGKSTPTTTSKKTPVKTEKKETKVSVPTVTTTTKAKPETKGKTNKEEVATPEVVKPVNKYEKATSADVIRALGEAQDKGKKVDAALLEAAKNLPYTKNKAMDELHALLVNESGATPEQIFAWIQKHGSQNHKFILNKIKDLPTVKAVKKVTLGGLYDEKNKTVGTGVYWPSTRLINLNVFANLSGDEANDINYMVSIALHEFLHAATYDLIAADTVFGQSIRDSINEISVKVKAYLDTLSKEERAKYYELDYAIADQQELIAVLFGDINLLELLGAIPDEQAKGIASAILQFLDRLMGSLFASFVMGGEPTKLLVDTITVANKLFTEAAKIEMESEEDFVPPTMGGTSNDADYFANRSEYEDTPIIDYVDAAPDFEAPTIDLADYYQEENPDVDLDIDAIINIPEGPISLDEVQALMDNSSTAGGMTINTNEYFRLGTLNSPIFTGEDAFPVLMHLATPDVSLKENAQNLVVRLEMEPTEENIKSAMGFLQTVSSTYISLKQIDFTDTYVSEQPLTLIAKDDAEGVRRLTDAVAQQMAVAFAIELGSNYTMQTDFRSDDDIRSILGLSESTVIPFDHPLRKAGFNLADVRDSLVRSVLNHTGLALNDKNITARQLDAIAEHIGLVVLTAASAPENSVLDYSLIRLENGRTVSFYTSKPNSNIAALAANEIMLEKLSGQKNLFNKPVTEKPTLESIRQYIRSRNPFKKNMKLSKKLRNRLLRHSSIPNKIFSDTREVFDKVSEAAQEAIFGVVPDAITNRLHYTQADSIKAKNEALKKTLSRFNSFKEETGDTLFYWLQAIVSNGRIMTDNTYLDPQNSKATRHFLGATASEVTVSTEDTDTNQTLNEFKKAVLQAFDKKPDLADRATINKIFKDILEDAEISALLDLFEKGSSFTEVAELELLQKVLHGGANFIADQPTYGFHALVGLMNYRKAVNEGSPTFESSLRYEIDGKTNGTAHALLDWFGAVSFEQMAELMAKVGIYVSDSAIQSFKEFKENGGQDHYQYFAANLSAALAALSEEVISPARKQALSRFMGYDGSTFAITRTLAKQPLMTLIYGAGVKGVTSYLVNDLIMNMYQKVADISNDVQDGVLTEEEGTQQLESLKEVIRVFTVSGLDSLDAGVKATATSMLNTLNKELKDLNLNTAKLWNLGTAETLLRVSLENIFEGVISDGMEAAYGQLVSKRAAVLKAAEQSYKLFKDIYRIRYNEKLKEINKDKEKAVYLLSAKAEQALIKELIKENLVPVLEGQSLRRDPKDKTISGMVALKTGKGTALESLFARQVYELSAFHYKGEEFNPEYEIKGDTLYIKDAYKLRSGRNQIISVTLYNEKNKRVVVKIGYSKSKEGGITYVNNKVADLMKQAGFNPTGLRYVTVRTKHDELDSPVSSESRGAALLILPPGVSTLVNPTHERDGTNQGLGGMDSNVPFLNVHDAAYYPLGTAERDAKDFNKAFLAIHRDGDNTILAHAAMLERMKNAYIKVASGVANKLSVEGVVSYTDSLISEVQTLGEKAQKDKLEFIGQVTSVNQFADSNAVWTKAATGKKPQQGYNQQVTRNSTATPLRNFKASESYNVDSTNVLSIYHSINSNADPVQTSTAHQQKLDNLMELMVAPVVGQLKLLVQNTRTATKGAYEVSTQGRVIKLQRGTFAPRWGMSRKEALAHEFVHSIVEFPLQLPSRYRNRLENLYDVAREYLKPTDLLDGSGPHSAADMQIAKSTYDYIFNNKDQQTVFNPYNTSGNLLEKVRYFNNGMHEFVAYGLTNERVGKALNNLFKNNPEAKKRFEQGEPFNGVKGDPNSTFFTKAIDMVNELFNYFTYKVRKMLNHIDGLTGKDADEALYLLTHKIAHLEATIGSTEMKVNNKLRQANEVTRKGVMYGLQKLGKGIDSIKKMGAENLAIIADKGSSGSLGAFMDAFYNRFDLDKDNLVRGLASELLGTTPQNRVVRDLLLQSREFIDKGREFMKSNVQTYVARLFSEELTEAESSSFARIVLNTDLVSLFDNNVSKILGFIENGVTRRQEIQKLETEIQKMSKKASTYILRQSEALGWYLIHSEFNHEGNGLFNAYQIAQLDGLDTKPDFDTVKMEALVDKLVTLHALENSDSVDRVTTATIFKRELVAGTSQENAIQKYLDAHKLIKEEAKTRLFDSQERLYRKGYTREQLDPYMGFEVVTEAEKLKYEADGFRVILLNKAKDDPNQEKMFIVFGEVFALETHARGVISTKNMSRRGANLFKGYNQVDPTDPANVGKAANDLLRIKKRRAIITKRLNSPTFVSKNVSNNLTPVYNPQGVVVDYRYEMSPEIKRTVLNKQEMFDETLGLTAASTVDKIQTEKINRKAVVAMYDIWKQEGTVSNQFVKVGKQGLTQEDRDMWFLMPEKAREEARALFGGDFVMVRKDDYRTWFGNRKPNLTTLANWLDTKTQNTILESTGNALASVLRHRYASIAFDSWKDIVSLAKERIVILNTAVLSANIMSNTLVLFMAGLVNPAKIISYQAEGYSHLKKFEKDHVEMMQTVLALSSNTLSNEEVKRLEAKARILEDRMANNPVAPLIDRGAYQTIVEDAAMLNDSFGYASKLERKFENIINKIPDVVKDVGNTIFMTKKTTTNQLLRDATSMSDFAARYALYKHRMDEGMEFDDAFNDAMESFITYEMPTNIHLQWMNDIGLMMFTKYFIRIQKVIFKRFRDNPLNVAALFGIEGMLGINVSDISDTALSPTNLGNRFYDPSAVIEPIIETNLISVATR